MIPIWIPPVADNIHQKVHRQNLLIFHSPSPGSRWVLVKYSRKLKTVLGESLIGHQGRAEVSSADQRHPPTSGDAHDLAQRITQFPYPVSHPPDTKFSEIGQVLANLGGIESASARQSGGKKQCSPLRHPSNGEPARKPIGDESSPPGYVLS